MFVFSTKQATETGNLEANMAQFNELTFARNSSAQAVADFIARTRVRGEAANAPVLDAVNAVDDIRRLYKAYDQTVLKQFEPNTEFTLLNDLMPLSRSVRLEESVYEYARTGGRGWAHTSMSGQIGAALDAKSYTFDGTMVPIHDSGFKFNWRDPVFNKGSALSSWRMLRPDLLMMCVASMWTISGKASAMQQATTSNSMTRPGRDCVTMSVWRR